jgi:hypothetical protein
MTDTLFVTSALAAEYTLPIIGGSYSMVPRNYIVGLEESISTGLTLATNTEYFIPLTSWVLFGGNWDNNEAVGFPNTYYMHANFGPSVTDPVAAYSDVTNALTVPLTDASTDTDT